jgi:transcriptional regulator with XRE-family HTH domain
MHSLGQKITIARISKGLKQKELADKAGLSQKYVSQIEHDHVDPRWSIVVRIATALDPQGLVWFLHATQEPTP